VHDAVLEADHGLTAPDLDPLAPHALTHHGAHVGVEGGHHLGTVGHHGDVAAAHYKSLGHLQADVAAAHDHDLFHAARLHHLEEVVGVLQRLHATDEWQVHARDVGAPRQRAGADVEDVEAEPIGPLVGVVADLDGPRVEVDGHRLV